MPDAFVGLVGEMFLVEIFRIDLAPLCSAPCWEVYAVGDISDVVLLRPVACPDVVEHLLRHPSVEA